MQPKLHFNIQNGEIFSYPLKTGTRSRPRIWKKLDPHLLGSCEKTDSMLLLNSNHPNIGLCIVHTICNIFALVLDKR